jgi:uncharacterized protein (DUF433 family)
MTAEQKALPADIVWISPDRVSGTPCFKGTRVPIQALIDHIEGNSTFEDFWKDSPHAGQVWTREKSAILGVVIIERHLWMVIDWPIGPQSCMRPATRLGTERVLNADDARDNLTVLRPNGSRTLNFVVDSTLAQSSLRPKPAPVAQAKTSQARGEQGNCAWLRGGTGGG